MISLIIIDDEIKKIEYDLKKLKEIEKERELYESEKYLKIKFDGALIELYAVKDKIKEAIKKECE